MFKIMWIVIMIIIAVLGIGGTLLLLRTKWSNPVRVPIIMTILATVISSEIVIGLVIWSPSSGSDEEATSVQAEKLSDEENTGPLTAEKEPNDTIKEANFIAVNSEIYGTLRDEDDVDYYYYEIEQRSSVSLDFFHDQIDDESEYCEISMFSIPQGSDISNMEDDPEKIESYEIYEIEQIMISVSFALIREFIA